MSIVTANLINLSHSFSFIRFSAKLCVHCNAGNGNCFCRLSGHWYMRVPNVVRTLFVFSGCIVYIVRQHGPNMKKTVHQSTKIHFLETYEDGACHLTADDNATTYVAGTKVARKKTASQALQNDTTTISTLGALFICNTFVLI